MLDYAEICRKLQNVRKCAENNKLCGNVRKTVNCAIPHPSHLICASDLFMLIQKYRSESDLVTWLLFGFEEVIVRVTDRECPLAHIRTIGIALAWLAACTE